MVVLLLFVLGFPEVPPPLKITPPFTHLGSVILVNILCHTCGHSLGGLNIERQDSRTGKKIYLQHINFSGGV